MVWEGTTATLLAVYPEKVETIKNRYTAFWKMDTKFRGRDECYPLNFVDAIIPIFLHHNTGQLIPTIRRNYAEKFAYYHAKIGEPFMFKHKEAK